MRASSDSEHVPCYRIGRWEKHLNIVCDLSGIDSCVDHSTQVHTSCSCEIAALQRHMTRGRSIPLMCSLLLVSPCTLLRVRCLSSVLGLLLGVAGEHCNFRSS
mmetsp:Transcript_142881/g.356058  ORF Transcript_142881/g.356058 Transcript_142881/m.356058 type:complete len:103 (-) Transcript_142881:87-395(-)